MYSLEHDLTYLVKRVDGCLSCLLDAHQLSADVGKIDIPKMLAELHTNCLRDIIKSIGDSDYPSAFADMAAGDVAESEILSLLSNEPERVRFSIELQAYRGAVTRIIDYTEAGDYSSAFDLIAKHGIKKVTLEIYRDPRLSKTKVGGLRDFIWMRDRIGPIAESMVKGKYSSVFAEMADRDITLREIREYLRIYSAKSTSESFEMNWKKHEGVLLQIVGFVKDKKYQDAMDCMKSNGVVFKEIGQRLADQDTFAKFLRTHGFEMGR
jgi:hypothetical protein